MRNTATCAPDESAISAASCTLPRCATTTAPPCSAALPTIATITAATKKSERCAFSANVSIEPTRISAISAVTTVAAASTPIALDNAQTSFVVLGRDVLRAVPAELPPRDADVEHEQEDRDRDREDGE